MAKPIIDFNFAMNFMYILRLSVCILLLFSCKKGQTPVPSSTYEGMDVSEIMESDDYFRLKRKAAEGKADSVSFRLVRMNDLNNDGSPDSALIEYNRLNSRYTLRFSCYRETIELENIAELEIKDMSDLNGDGHHELLLFLQSEESCWDEIRLFSWLGKWVEKYNGLTYQCTENNNYQFRKIDQNTVQLTTYGINRDSIDAEHGDTLENVIPNALNSHLITW